MDGTRLNGNPFKPSAICCARRTMMLEKPRCKDCVVDIIFMILHLLNESSSWKFQFKK